MQSACEPAHQLRVWSIYSNKAIAVRDNSSEAREVLFQAGDGRHQQLQDPPKLFQEAQCRPGDNNPPFDGNSQLQIISERRDRQAGEGEVPGQLRVPAVVQEVL